MAPGTTIREAGEGDVAALAGLRWAWHLEGGGSPEGHDAYLAAFADWTRAVAHTHRAFLAAEEPGGAAVGMAWLAAVERPPGPDAPRRRGGDLQSVYVVPAWRGTGLATRLIDTVVAAATDAGMAHLSVRTGRRSRTFYLRHGFAQPDLLLLRDLSRPAVDPGATRSTQG